MARETRLGLFFLLGLVLVGFVTLTVSQWTPPWRRGHVLVVYFPNVEGLRVGDPVRVAGVQNGRVLSVQLEEKRVRVELELEDRPTLREDYAILIQESALIGGKFVEVAPGTAVKREIDAHQPLKGSALPSPVQELAKLIEENRANLRETIADVREVMRSVREGPGTLHELIANKALYEKIDKAASHLEAFSEKIDAGQGTAGKLVNDPALYDDLKAVASDLKAITGRIQQGPGAIHAAVYDPELGKDLKQAVEDIRGTAAGLREMIEKVQSGDKPLLAYLVDEKSYQQAEQAIQDFGKVVGRAARVEFWLGAGYTRYGDSELGVSRVGLRLQPGDDKYFMAGAAFMSLSAGGDIDFEEKLTKQDDDLEIAPELQAAYRMGFLLSELDPAWLRLGLIEGKPGAAIDVEWKDSPLLGTDLTFTAEGRDAYGSVDDEDLDEQIHGPLLRGYVTARIWKGFEAYAGASRIGQDAELMTGLSFEYNDEDLRSLVALLGLGQ
jgi:phospholipid/cholesterol/gamma-HCH transport system substrate-binding protein